MTSDHRYHEITPKYLNEILSRNLSDVERQFRSTYSVLHSMDKTVDALRGLDREYGLLPDDILADIPDTSDRSEMIAGLLDMRSTLPSPESFRDLLSTHASIVSWFFEHKWPIPLSVPFSSLLRLKHRCVGTTQQQITERIERLVARHYNTSHISHLKKEWKEKPLLDSRVRVLNSGLNSHLRRDYIASTSTLLPQIEGVLTEIVGHKGRLNSSDLTNYLKNVLLEPTRKRGHEDLRGVSNAAYVELIEKLVFGKFQHGAPVPFDLNRHAILHGADSSYDKKETSLKLIVILEFLIDRLRFVALKSTKVYHQFDCPYIRSRPILSCIQLDSVAVARASGLRPCSFCLDNIQKNEKRAKRRT